MPYTKLIKKTHLAGIVLPAVVVVAIQRVHAAPPQVGAVHVPEVAVALQHAQRKQDLLLGRPLGAQLGAQQAQPQLLQFSRCKVSRLEVRYLRFLSSKGGWGQAACA